MDKRSNADNRNLCCFSYSDGRRCRMLRHPNHPGLCPFHSREERQALESERIGSELAATLTGHYLTASDINHVLGKVFTALAQDRISVKKAKALAYLAQLMLASHRYAYQETRIRYSWESWQRMLKNATKLPDPPAPINPWESPDETSSAADAPNVGAGFSPSPAAHATNVSGPTLDRHSPNGRHSATSESAGDSTSPSASPVAYEGGRARLQPCLKQDRRQPHPSSAHPSANSADACADSFSVKRNDNASPEGLHEDNTEEPALVGAGSTSRR